MQQVIDSEKCAPLNYTVYSKRDYEFLLLEGSSLPVSGYVSKESTQQDIFSYEDLIKGALDSIHNQSGCIPPLLL